MIQFGPVKPRPLFKLLGKEERSIPFFPYIGMWEGLGLELICYCVGSEIKASTGWKEGRTEPERGGLCYGDL